MSKGFETKSADGGKNSLPQANFTLNSNPFQHVGVFVIAVGKAILSSDGLAKSCLVSDGANGNAC